MKAGKIYIHDIVQEKNQLQNILISHVDIKTSALDWPVSHQSSQLLSTNDMKKKNGEIIRIPIMEKRSSPDVDLQSIFCFRKGQTDLSLYKLAAKSIGLSNCVLPSAFGHPKF